MKTASYIYGLAFLTAPMTATLVLGFSALSAVMIHKQPDPIPGMTLPAPRLPHHSHRAMILLSNQGTELTDFMAPIAVFDASGAFDFFTAAPERRLSPTSAPLAVLPDYDLASAPPADLLVIPAVMDPDNAILVDWIRRNSGKFKWVLSLCEGARLAAQAGIMDGKRATSHFMALPSLERDAPSVRWQDDARVVIDGTLISSAGVTASVDASLAAVGLIAGEQAREKARAALGFDSSHLREAREHGELGAAKWLGLFLRSAYDWDRPTLAVALNPGANELALAGELEPVTRSMHFQVSTTSPRRELLPTQAGVWVASSSAPDLQTPPPAIYVIPPGGDSKKNNPQLPPSTRIVDPPRATPAEAFGRALSLVSESGADANLVARLIEYPETAEEQAQAAKNLSWFWLYRPLLIGILGALVARVFLGRRGKMPARPNKLAPPVGTA